MILGLGADLCGFANIGSFCGAPEGFHPSDIFADCKSVIVFGLALPKGLSKASPKLVYAHFNDCICPPLDFIAFCAAKQIEAEFGGYAVPLPSDGPYDYWDSEKSEGRGLISMKHAAVAAGLGTLGRSTLLLNSRYGNMLILGAVLTDLDLPSDPARGIDLHQRLRSLPFRLSGTGIGWPVSQSKKVQSKYLRDKCQRVFHSELQSMPDGLSSEIRY